jgi:hypothetical protein
MQRTVLIAAAFGLALSAGCGSTRPAIDGGNEIRIDGFSGSFTTFIQQPLERAHAAAQESVGSMKFQIERDALDAFKGIIVARTADRTAVNITISKQGPTLSELVVSGGGSRSGIAEAIVRDIQQRTR